MSFPLYRHLLRPLLFAVDSEAVHHLGLSALSLAGVQLRRLRRWRRKTHPDLVRTVFGVRFPNPVGLAAGFDKNGIALPAWEGLGFGFAEIGTVTARAQPGNPKPRIFRVPEERALINRLGFNNDGADAIAGRLKQTREAGHWPSIPIGINLGKSKVTPLEEATADYLLSFERLRGFADYVVLNVSSPNTPGLRALQSRSALDELLGHIQRRNTSGLPVLVKIAPDLEWDAIEEILALAEEHRLAGLIATNTTVDHSGVSAKRRTTGGLSGGPLRERATAVVRFIAERTTRPVIAVGGILTPDDALEKFDAGAALIQLYTGLVYEGPALAQRICDALLARRG